MEFCIKQTCGRIHLILHWWMRLGMLEALLFKNFIKMLCIYNDTWKNEDEVKIWANGRKYRRLNASCRARVLWKPWHLHNPNKHTHRQVTGEEWRAHTIPHIAPGPWWLTANVDLQEHGTVALEYINTVHGSFLLLITSLRTEGFSDSKRL